MKQSLLKPTNYHIDVHAMPKDYRLSRVTYYLIAHQILTRLETTFSHNRSKLATGSFQARNIINCLSLVK